MNTLVSAVALALAFAERRPASAGPKAAGQRRAGADLRGKAQRESQPLIGYDDANEEKLAGFIESLLRNTRQT